MFRFAEKVSDAHELQKRKREHIFCSDLSFINTQNIQIP